MSDAHVRNELSREGETDPALLHAIRKLARRGAYVLHPAETNGSVCILVDGPGGAVDAGEVATGAIEAALARAWLVSTDGGARIEMTASGRSALRRAINLQQASGARAGKLNPPDLQTSREPAINDAESPLSWLRARLDKNGQPLITAEQYDAGERLRADLWRARMTPRVTASWSGIAQASNGRSGAPGAGLDMADSIVAAMQRVERAFKAVGTEHIDVLFDTCGHLKGLEQIERDAKLPPRSGKRFLQNALTALARHYGLLPNVDVEAKIRQRLRHWGSPDYRPSITISGRD